jgi:hypothetical protein
LNIDVTGIVIIVGNYGSGKTETAVNLAALRKMAGLTVKIADLDLVNPYFRTREARISLEALGIEVVLPDKQYMHADLPILSPTVAGMIGSPADLILLDSGGDDVGVTVLAALKDAFKNKTVNMLQVINPFRPFTGNVKGCIKIKEEIEESSNLKVTGLVSNANLIDETSLEDIYKGYELLKEVSRKTGVKIEFITVPSNLISQLDMNHFDCPILRIDRKMIPPWKNII